jgi:hypothetical protein
MKALIKLVIAALVIHATWRAGNAYLRYYRFKDGLQQAAQFSLGRSVNDVHSQAVELAKQNDVPIKPDDIAVKRQDNHTLIDASYEEHIELLPRYYYPYTFKVTVDAFTIVPRND